jgi:hypothetical protein
MSKHIKSISIYLLAALGIISIALYSMHLNKEKRAALEESFDQYFGQFWYYKNNQKELKRLEASCRKFKGYETYWELGKAIDSSYHLHKAWLEHQIGSVDFHLVFNILNAFATDCIDQTKAMNLQNTKVQEILVKELEEITHKLDSNSKAYDWGLEPDFQETFLKMELLLLRNAYLELIESYVGTKVLCCMGSSGIAAIGNNQPYPHNSTVRFELLQYDQCAFPRKGELQYYFPYEKDNIYYPQKRGLDSVRVNIRQYDGFGDFKDSYAGYLKFWVY